LATGAGDAQNEDGDAAHLRSAATEISAWPERLAGDLDEGLLNRLIRKAEKHEYNILLF
jgi:hypothetical protein